MGPTGTVLQPAPNVLPLAAVNDLRPMTFDHSTANPFRWFYSLFFVDTYADQPGKRSIAMSLTAFG